MRDCSPHPLPVGDLATPPAPVQGAAKPARPSATLPVADLVGLRFSVVHLRLAGYGLLGVWISEIAGLLTAPLLTAVGTRLTYISQALDLSPLLLVGLGLIAVQGGLQRSLVERLLLPLLFATLPLLSALHFLMAPASIANALTLSSKQVDVSRSQLRSIEGQLDRAGQVLQSSQDLETLRRRLDAIPGVRVSSSPNLSLEQARLEVAESLRNERRRVRVQIGVSTAQARSQFTRRAIQNATLAVVIGVVLAWIRAASLQEMELSAAYLSWVLVSDPADGRSSGLRALLDFQKACLGTSYLALIERMIKLASRPVDREEAERQKQMEQELIEGLQSAPPEESAPPPPWDPDAFRIRSEAWRRRIGMFHGKPGSPQEPEEFGELPFEEADLPGSASPSPRAIRRQQRDQERVRSAMAEFARSVTGFDDALYEQEDPQQNRRARRPSQRQLKLAREALERFAAQFEEDIGTSMPDDRPDDPRGYGPARAGDDLGRMQDPNPATNPAPAMDPANGRRGGPLRRVLDRLFSWL
jgi:hypothetical protein